MAKLTNINVIKGFLQGEKGIESHTGNLWVSHDGGRLMNYSTCLVEYHDETREWLFNITKYSSTTSKIQTYIRRELGIHYSVNRVKEVQSIPMSTSFLSLHKYMEVK